MGLMIMRGWLLGKNGLDREIEDSFTMLEYLHLYQTNTNKNRVTKIILITL